MAVPLVARGVPIVQPAAQRQPPRPLMQEETIALTRHDYSRANVTFIQGMTVHHRQGVDLAELVGKRINTPDMVAAAGRIDDWWKDELEFMRS